MKHSTIALIGMMGSGKSTVALQLAKKLNFNLFELDEIFEDQNKIKIKDFFEAYGEEKFRQKEHEILKKAIGIEFSVISCGGGIVLKKENQKLLFKNKKILTIYLQTSAQEICNRLKNDKTRPLLQVENPKEEIEKILSSRENLYKQAKMTVITDNKTPEEVAEEILGQLWIQ